MKVESSIINYLNKRLSLDEIEISYLDEVFEIKEYPKSEIILNKGEICHYIYFIEKGCLKTYFVNNEEDEAINGIAIDNNFCTAVTSFINQNPSSEIIEAIENTKLIRISHKNFKKLISKYPKYKDIYIQILEEYLAFMTWRIESVMLMDSKERYNTLMKIYPKLFLRLPSKILAKYLGMSQETLSRIKSA